MEQVAKLLEQLATKLGTTVEYLWSVLVRQAKIQMMVDVVLLVAAIIILLLMIYYTVYILKPSKEDEDKNNFAYWEGEDCVFPVISYILALVGSCIIIIVIFATKIPELLTVIYNPEYWALQEILQKLGK